MDTALIVGIAALTPPYLYLLAYVISKAYFANKTEYHRNLFKNISTGGIIDG